MMSEFILNTEGATAAQWHSLDEFTQGFIEAAFFSNSSCYDSSEFFTAEAQERVQEGQADGSIPSDAGPSDIEPDSLALIKAVCAEFQGRAAALLSEAYKRDYDATQAGRDFYFTRAGYGVGYWDREALKDEDSGEYERLTDIMRGASKSGDNAAWNAACWARADIKTLGDKLTAASGSGEISLDANESADSESGFFVSFYIG